MEKQECRVREDDAAALRPIYARLGAQTDTINSLIKDAE
jgi:hypothetical protein